MHIEVRPVEYGIPFQVGDRVLLGEDGDALVIIDFGTDDAGKGSAAVVLLSPESQAALGHELLRSARTGAVRRAAAQRERDALGGEKL